MSEGTASLAGVRLKIERAEKHFRDLVDARERFLKSRPYEVVIQDNAETGRREWIAYARRPVPPEIALITGDAVHNLRSALDHLIRQLLIANRKDPEEYPRSAFPVWRSEADYEAGRPGDAEGISKPALDILDRLKPYKGGNDALWRLRQLDVVDKHRLLLAVGSANTNLIIDSRKLMISTHPGHDWLKKGPGVRAAYKAAEPTVITKEGAIFRTAPLGHEPEDYVEFPLDVALNEPTVGKPEPLVPAIHELVRFTDEIVGLFEPLILESI